MTMKKTKPVKRSRFATYSLDQALADKYRIAEQDELYEKSLSKEKREKIYKQKLQAEEDIKNKLLEEKEDSYSFLDNVKQFGKDLYESAKNTKWSDIADTYRMFTQGLGRLIRDESLEDVRRNQENMDIVKSIAAYKQLLIDKHDLENSLLDPNSNLTQNQAIDIQRRLNDINDRIAKYDSYFLTEGRLNPIVAQQMFDTSKLTGLEDAKLNYLNMTRNVRLAATKQDYLNNPLGSFANDLIGTFELAVSPLTYAQDMIDGFISYVKGDAKKPQLAVLANGISRLDQNDPLLYKLYKGNTTLDRLAAYKIDSEEVGQFNNGQYTPGSWYNAYERDKNKAHLTLKDRLQFLKDGKLFGMDIVDYEDINPQFKAEHDEYGSNFSDIIKHPLHGLVETNSTVGMMVYQIPALSFESVARLAAQRVPAIAAVSAAAAIGSSVGGAYLSRQQETASEAISAVGERVAQSVNQNGGNTKLITTQLVEQAMLAGLDVSEYVNKKTDIAGNVYYEPKDAQGLSEILKIGAAYNFSTSDITFERAKVEARRGINKLINANNALAVSDYVQALPFLSFSGKALRGNLLNKSTKEILNEQATRNFTKETVSDKLRNFLRGGKYTQTLVGVADASAGELVALKDRAIDKATAKFLGQDVSKALMLRDAAKYVANKTKLIAQEGVLEGLEEVVQTKLTNRYKRGEFDDYNKATNGFDIDEIDSDALMALSYVGHMLGLNTSDPDNQDNELRKSFNIGFASSILFGGLSHAKGNILSEHDDNIRALMAQLRDDKIIGKVFAEQQANIQDLTHLGMYYDAMSKNKRSAAYMKERLDFLKKNLDKDHSLVTEGFIDADKQLVDALDAVMHNEELRQFIKENTKSITEFEKKHGDKNYDAEKWLMVNAAKAVADANTANELVDMFGSSAELKFNIMMSRVLNLFDIDGQVETDAIEQFKQQNPKLYETIQALLNQHEKHKEAVKQKYESDFKNSKSVTQEDYEKSRKEQIEHLWDEKNIDEFFSNPYILTIARRNILLQSRAELAREINRMYKKEDHSDIVDKIFKMLSEGYSEKDFVFDRLHALNINKQKNAAEHAYTLIANQNARLSKIKELTGLDLDLSRLRGMELTAKEQLKSYITRIDKILGNDKIRERNKEREKKGSTETEKEYTLDDVLPEGLTFDEEYNNDEEYSNLMLAKIVAESLNIRRSAYLSKQLLSPVTIRDMLSRPEYTDEIFNKLSDEYLSVVDQLRNDELLGQTVKERQKKELRPLELSKEAKKAYILSEIKDLEKRRYIANKRRTTEAPTPNDIERADNGDNEARERLINDLAKEEEKKEEQISTTSGASENTLRKKYNLGKRKTKADKEQELKEARAKFEKAATQDESLIDNEAEVNEEDDFLSQLLQEGSEEDNEGALSEEESLPKIEEFEEEDEDDEENEEEITEEEVETDDSEPEDDVRKDEDKVSANMRDEDPEPQEFEPQDSAQQEDLENQEGELTSNEELDESYSPTTEEFTQEYSPTLENQEEEGEISQQSFEEDYEKLLLSEDEFLIGGEEDVLDGLTLLEETDAADHLIALNKNGKRIDENVFEGQLDALIQHEYGTLDLNDLIDNPTKHEATDYNIGGLINSTLFYQPDATETIDLKIDGKPVELPKPLAPGKVLSEKLQKQGWLGSAKKYWIVTQSLTAQKIKHDEKAKDAMTVSLIIEDDTNCYAVTYRALGELKSDETDDNGKVVKRYTKNKELDLKDELYLKNIDWDLLVQLAEKVGVEVTATPSSNRANRAKFAKKVFEARAVEIARGEYVATLGKGSDTNFDRWWHGLQPSLYPGGENSEKYQIDRQNRISIMSSAYQNARQSVTKVGKTPFTIYEIDKQIKLLRQHRNEVIDAYLIKLKDKKGNIVYKFPEKVRTDVRPKIVTQSNGKFNILYLEGTTLHKFSNPMEGLSLQQIADEIESGNAVFGFGLGRFGSSSYEIQRLFTPLTKKEYLREDGKPIGRGLAGKIYMVVDTPNGTRVPVMLRESKFNTQTVEKNGKTKKIFLEGDEAWKDDSKGTKFKECFEIDPNTSRPRLVDDLDGYKPSIAEILFYMVCQKFDTPNSRIVSELFIHNGAGTILTDDIKHSLTNSYLGGKQLYWGPINNLGLPYDNETGLNIPLSDYGLIIGMKGEDGRFYPKVYMHDELFSTSEEAKNDRRDIIRAIATLMHWSMDSLLLKDKADAADFADGFGSFVKEVLRQNPNQEECSFYGCPELTFKRSDFETIGSDDLLKQIPVQYMAWCLSNGKLQTDVDMNNPLVDPFVFGEGVKESPQKQVLDKLGSTDGETAKLTGDKLMTEDGLLWENAEYDPEYWNNFQSKERLSFYNYIKSFWKQDKNAKQDFIDSQSNTKGAQDHGGLRDIVVFRLPEFSKRPDTPKQTVEFLLNKLKEFIDKYNKLPKKEGVEEVQYSDDLIKKIESGIKSNYHSRKYLPVLTIYNDGKCNLYMRPMDKSFMKTNEGITGIYSKVRGSGKMNAELSRTWLKEKLGVADENVIVLNGLLRGTTSEPVYGITTLAVNAIMNEITNGAYILLSKQAGAGIAYHEGWHYVNLLLHDKQTRKAIYDAYVKTHKKFQKDNVTYEDVEEALAEDFRKYVLLHSDKSLLGKVKRAFKNILNFLLYSSNKPLYQLIFEDILSGRYNSPEIKIDEQSRKEFMEKYAQLGGAFSKVKNIAGLSNETLSKLNHLTSLNDFFETLDGCINAICYELNLDSIDKIKAYNGKNFDEIVAIIENLRDRQTDYLQADYLQDVLDNPEIIKKALADYFMSLGVNLKIKKNNKIKVDEGVASAIVETDKEKELGEALEKEEDPENKWDEIKLNVSHKDNAAIRAKMFLKRVPKLTRKLDSKGNVFYEEVLDKFGTPMFWKYDEVWNLIMEELHTCDTLDQIDPNTNDYSTTSIRGSVKRLAKSNAMFYALDSKFDDIEDDILLRNQIFTTISVSKHNIMTAFIKDLLNRILSYVEEEYSVNAVEDENIDQMQDDWVEEDRKRIWDFLKDSNLLVAKSIPRKWSQNLALNGLIIYNSKQNKNVISKNFVKQLKPYVDLHVHDSLINIINKYKSQKKSKGKLAVSDLDISNALYGANGIRLRFIDLCNMLGIPMDNDVLDEYIRMFIDKETISPLDQINAFADMFQTPVGSLGKIIEVLKQNGGASEFAKNALGNHKTELDTVFDGYSVDSNIGKLAIAYNNIHPSLAEYAVRDVNGNFIYPMNLPNELSDKTNKLNRDLEYVAEMQKSKLCEHSIILDAASKIRKDSPRTKLALNTFIGLKDNNSLLGTDNAQLTAVEDTLCKMFLTELDHIIFPTMADKKMWETLTSENIKLSHDLLVISPRKQDEMPYVLELYEKTGYVYDADKYQSLKQYNNEAYKWYLSLPEDNEVKTYIKNNALEKTLTKGLLTYRRFSDDTLLRFAKLFLDEINALIEYYDESHIENLKTYPNKLIKNFHGKFDKNGRMDFSGNGGKFRYFYDTFLSTPFANVYTSDKQFENDLRIENTLNLNLNQKLQALFELQKQIENGLVNYYTLNKRGQRVIDPQYDAVSTLQSLRKTTKECDGFELIRDFLQTLKDQIVVNGKFTIEALDAVNNKLISMTERSLYGYSEEGSPFLLLQKDTRTGLYKPEKLPTQLFKQYLERLSKAYGITDGVVIYSEDESADERFAIIQATYSLIANFTANTMLSVMEVEKVYTGESAMYKKTTSDTQTECRLFNYKIGDMLIDINVQVENMKDTFSDKIKRLGGVLSPGNKLRLDYSEYELSIDPTLKSTRYTVLNVEDIEVGSVYRDIIERHFKTQLVVNYIRSYNVPGFEKIVSEQIKNKTAENREIVIDKLYKNYEFVQEVYSMLSNDAKKEIDVGLYSQMRPYSNINVCDALVFIRPALYRKIRIGLGEWSFEEDENGYSDEKAYNICEKNDNWMSDPELSKLVHKFQINALKMSYFQNDPFDDCGMAINKPIYNKMALFPLFKMHRSTTVGRQLYDRMNLEGNEIDMVAFKSAVKVGANQKASNIIDKDDLASINKDLLVITKKDGTKVAVKPNDQTVIYSTDAIKDNTSKNTLAISVQDLHNIRLLLNTRAHEVDERSLGSQLLKIALSNIIDDAYYGTHKKGRQPRLGSAIKSDIIRCILRLTNIGIDNIRKEFYTDNKLDDRKVKAYIQRIAINKGLSENTAQLLAEGAVAAGLMSRMVFEQNVSSAVNKKIVDVTTKGGTAIQLSVFGFIGYDNNSVDTLEGDAYVQFNEGKELKWITEEGSMEVLLSMNFFKSVVPKKYQTDYKTMRQWLIDHDVIKGKKSVEYWKLSLKDASLLLLLDTNVVNFDFSVRLLKILLKNNITTIWDIISNKSTLIPLLGSKLQTELQDAFDSVNISFETQHPETTPVYSNPKPFGVGYRVPTQGMSSTFSFIVADVLPENVGDLIVVPREFTALTGSDFDVDKLYLATYSYNVEGDESTREVESKDNTTAGAIGNTLIDNYIDIISDRRNFGDARGSIDVITKIIHEEFIDKVLRDNTSEYIEGMLELTPKFLALRRLEFGVGKTGIGPFALNITNHALTLFTHLTMDFGDNPFNLSPLDRIEGQDGKFISAWLSAMVNAHVDVAKDPYIFDLNINQFTYNHTNLLFRAGKGITTLSFLAQPVIKKLANYMNNVGGIYGNNIDGTTPLNESKKKKYEKYIKKLFNQYRDLLEQCLESSNISKQSSVAANEAIEWIKWYYPKKDESKEIDQLKQDNTKAPKIPDAIKDVFDYNKSCNAIKTIRHSSDVNELISAYIHQIVSLRAYTMLDEYAQALSSLVHCSQIDTKKFGNTIALLRNFKNKYDTFRTTSRLWTINDPDFIQSVPIRDGKKQPLLADISFTALDKYFSTTYLDKKFEAALKYTRGILMRLLFTATDVFNDTFTTICSTLFGSTEVETIDGKKYKLYGEIYRDETVQTLANAIENIIRYNVFVNHGVNVAKFLNKRKNSEFIDFIGLGSSTIKQNMSRLLFGTKDEAPIFDRVAKLIKDIRKNSQKDEYFELLDNDGNIANQFLLYLNPQTANNQFPIGRMTLSIPLSLITSDVKRRLTFDFGQLIRSKDEEISKLGKDLAFYAYFSTYDQNTAYSFFDLVPAEFRSQYDLSLKHALKHTRDLDILQNILGQDVLEDDVNQDLDVLKNHLVSKASNEMLDILSRNFWYNDDIVSRFYPKYDAKYPSFNKDGGDVLSASVYDAQSGRSFNTWIATTRTNDIYFKVTRGVTTMLYKKIGTVDRTEEVVRKGSKEPTKKVTTYNVYAVVPKAGLHKGKFNYFEFYCNYTTPSIFEHNRIDGAVFAFDKVKKSVKSRVKSLLKGDTTHTYQINWMNEDDSAVNETYVSTNSDIYNINDNVVVSSEEQEIDYAKIARSRANMDRAGVENSDCVINIVQVDKGPEVNRSTSKPLSDAKNIVDVVLDGDTSTVIKKLSELDNLHIVLYITSSMYDGYLAAQSELDELRLKKISQYITDHTVNGLAEADIESLAKSYGESLEDRTLNYEIFGEKLNKFLNNLILDLKMNNIKLNHLSAPFNQHKQEISLAVMKTHKIHYDYFEEKAVLYPSIKFMLKSKLYKAILERFKAELAEITPASDDYYEAKADIEQDFEKLAKTVEKQSIRPTNKFATAVSLDEDEYSTNVSDNNPSEDDGLDILTESSNSKEHENC